MAKVEQSIAQIVDAIADGMYHPSMKEKMTALEARKIAIRDELSELGEEEPLRLHPGLSDIYRRKVAALTEALNKDEIARNEAVEVLRGLISTIRLTPDVRAISISNSWVSSARSCCLGRQTTKSPVGVPTGLIMQGWLRGPERRETCKLPISSRPAFSQHPLLAQRAIILRSTD